MLNRYLPRIEFTSYDDFAENFTINAPDNFNFGYDVVDEWARLEPDKRALLWVNDEGEDRSFTFGDIRSLSNRAANYFRLAGISKGDRVLCVLRRRWEYWVTAAALCKIGATIIPGTLQMMKKDIIYRAESAGISTLICVDDASIVEQAEAAAALSPGIKNLLLVGEKRQGWTDYGAVLADVSLSDVYNERVTVNDDIMLIYFTSGTTKLPKMVMHNFLHPLGHIITAKYWQHVEENALHMSVADSAWAKFGWGKIYGQWLCGASVFCYDMTGKFRPIKLLEKIAKYKVATFCCPPTTYRFLLQEDVGKYDLSGLHHCTTAGEPLNPEVIKQWRALTGHTIHEGFGQSEGPVLIANFGWDEIKPGSTGKPSPLLNVKVLDVDGREMEDGEEGAICVTAKKPIGLFVGYYGDVEATQAALGGDCYNLHDMAWRDSDGYINFVGRDDDMIKSSGYRIGPFEVESALIEHPAVVECAITGVPDPEGTRGQLIKASVILAKGFEPSDELIKELQDHVKHTTAPYKYPRVIEFVEDLPKTLGGKIKRAEIRKG
ncbi:MAG: AMP-binding protein [Oscillospiraceae bacterium]|jgi:acetyl-CoA synthetase|nr:AMP-binding protein [Oscillospiraceae bacterium]